MLNTPGYNPPPAGSRLEAGWLRELWAMVRRQTKLIAGPGLQVTERPDGARVVGLAGAAPQRFEAVIVAAPVFEPRPPADTIYTAQAIGRPELRLTNALPEMGRPTANDQWMLWPAKVGHPCTIVRTRDAAGNATDVLWIHTEAIAARPCG